MSRKWILFGIVLLAAALGVYWSLPPQANVESAEIEDGIQVKFRTIGSQVEMYSDGTWKPYFAKGVNIGATIPGHFPGELAITKDDYIRWFGMIQDMGANVIRVYTILQPEFYEALVTYNARHTDEPLFFIQGVWSPEEQLIEWQDAFDPEIKQQFEQEIRDAVHAVYGKAKLEPKPHSGKAYGTYLFNAGPYLLGWIIGTEWDPKMVDRTNQLHADLPDYIGTHFRSKPGASAFEKWLAEMVDITAETEMQYGWQHPIAFSNWVTTDPLEHPGEPLVEEDLVSVDPELVEPIDWEAGYFASYHVYPYYPDFFTFDKTFQTMTNDKGEIDSYLTYLHRLREYHQDMPVMITEFGVPASLGVAHIGPLGRNQGGHDERQQGEINAEMFRQIHEAGYAGAILFAWQDEWFKRTWNTQYYDIPDRRAYWYNFLTNEAHFGVLGMYPSKHDKIVIDGDGSDWDKLKRNEKTKLELNLDGFEAVWAAHDEGYLYLLLRLAEPFDPAEQTLYIGTDTLPGGNRQAQELQNAALDEGLETLVELSDESSRVWIASNYDFHTRMFSEAGMDPVDPGVFEDNSGIFHPWKLVVSYQLEYPDSRFEHPFKDEEVGTLLRGYGDPNHPEYNSLAMWQTNGELVEIRIPWMLLGFSDPSSLTVINYGKPQGRLLEQIRVGGIRLLPWIVDRQTGELIGLPTGETYSLTALPRYTWESWEDKDVKYVERLKESYYIMQQAMMEVNSPVLQP